MIASVSELLLNINAQLQQSDTIFIPKYQQYWNSTDVYMMTYWGPLMAIMLDLSVVFDTVDHDILLKSLKSVLSICGTALNWFKSSQSVPINGTQSKPTSLVCGMPQGSVLGPILFTVYMLPLSDIIKRHVCRWLSIIYYFRSIDINQTALNIDWWHSRLVLR